MSKASVIDTHVGRLGKYRLYAIWQNMKRRCHYEKHHNYKYYGARGIEVCQEWRFDFRAFEAWALENGYSEKLQIDRADNDASYSPSNCRWVERLVNVNNRRSNRVISIHGESLSVADAARKHKLNYHRFRYLILMGHNPEDAATRCKVEA